MRFEKMLVLRIKSVIFKTRK